MSLKLVIYWRYESPFSDMASPGSEISADISISSIKNVIINKYSSYFINNSFTHIPIKQKYYEKLNAPLSLLLHTLELPGHLGHWAGNSNV